MVSMRVRVIVLFACLMGAAAAVARADRYEQPPPRTAFAAFPMQIGEWHGVEDPPMPKAVLDVLRADDVLTRTYYTSSMPGLSGRAVAGLYVGYWQSQRQGDAIHSPLNCLPGAGWEPVSRAALSFADPRNPGAVVSINRYVIEKGLDRELVLYWYQSHARIVASEYWSKFYLVADAVRLNRTDGAIVRVITPIRDDARDAEQMAEANAMGFVKELLPRLDGFLPG
jgi:EpsI family protein